MYEEEGNEDARVWYCLAHAECRNSSRTILCTKTTTSKCSDHLRIEHGVESSRSRALAANKDEREAVAARATSELCKMKELNQEDRYHELDFVNTFVMGDFQPFIIAEKEHVRHWLTMNGE